MSSTTRSTSRSARTTSEIDFTLPPDEYGSAWEIVIDTLNGVDEDMPEVVAAGAEVPIGPRAIVVLRRAD